MTASPHPALHRLALILERENAALAALDLAAIGGLLAEKQAALAALPATPLPAEAAHALAALATRNRALLERAIAVQGRVIALIARAAPPSANSYRAPGHRAATNRIVPRALCARV